MRILTFRRYVNLMNNKGNDMRISEDLVTYTVTS